LQGHPTAYELHFVQFYHNTFTNERNFHSWSHDNPYEAVQSNFQHRYTINIVK